MKQPLARLYDKNGKEYGNKRVQAVRWNPDGEIDYISIYFLSDHDTMGMYLNINNGVFESLAGGIFAEILQP